MTEGRACWRSLRVRIMGKSIKGRASSKVIGQGVAAKSRALSRPVRFTRDGNQNDYRAIEMTISDASAADHSCSIVMLIEMERRSKSRCPCAPRRDPLWIFFRLFASIDRYADAVLFGQIRCSSRRVNEALVSRNIPLRKNARVIGIAYSRHRRAYPVDRIAEIIFTYSW